MIVQLPNERKVPTNVLIEQARQVEQARLQPDMSRLFQLKTQDAFGRVRLGKEQHIADFASRWSASFWKLP